MASSEDALASLQRSREMIAALMEADGELRAERDAARADLAVLLDAIEQVGWTFVPLQDLPSTDIPGNTVRGVIYDNEQPSVTDVQSLPVFVVRGEAALSLLAARVEPAAQGEKQ